MKNKAYVLTSTLVLLAFTASACSSAATSVPPAPPATAEVATLEFPGEPSAVPTVEATPQAVSTPAAVPAESLAYPVVDTGQNQCFDNNGEITCPTQSAEFYGQDAQYIGIQPSYTISSDGLTVQDDNTGLIWIKAYAHDATVSHYNPSDGANTDYRFTYDEATAYIARLNSQNFGGYSDWRLPNIKELLSLAQFTGDSATKTPFFDVSVFDWIDVTTTGSNLGPEMGQTWSSTGYVGSPEGGAFFFYNFADGHLKRGPGESRRDQAKANLLRLVRGPVYGINVFVDNADGTISDTATGLMWSQDDSSAGMDWQTALAWVQQKNAENYLGYNDWRLPNAKELQSLVDYDWAPTAVHGWGNQGAAIDPIFNITSIPSTDSYTEYPFFWSSTTDAEKTHGFAYHVTFGRAMTVILTDSHGAGALRASPKDDDGTNWSRGLGPYPGGLVRIDNFVRLVRDIFPGSH